MGGRKSANSRFFSFALGAFAFFHAFFSLRFRALILPSRSRARKREKSARAHLCSVVAHWGGKWTVPWPLVLRLLASAELCSTGPASPAGSSQELSDLSGLDPGDPLGLMQDVP